MPDFNPDKDRGMGRIKYVVRNAHKGVGGPPIKTLQTGAGELKLDKKGRCIIADAALAAEVRKQYPHDLAVSRIFTDDPADRGHHFFWGQMPEPVYKIFERWKKAGILLVNPREAYDLSLRSEFYSVNDWYFDGRPALLDGETGYDDDLGKRIVIKNDTEAQKAGDPEAGTGAPEAEQDYNGEGIA